ncbi:Piwi-domain-containing protein [Lophiostoma macrostomum CBS 122681]|uniref:Piwi-domain-containing protein n=1 Tax=Lophiostoma macrostomum CBS 122681 TaxID=1314788 RepID=A0A6A6TF63_9PLEO|nr:Piwi-domain-containing protein [Lophiostoma macrostomum CBS 122681]
MSSLKRAGNTLETDNGPKLADPPDVSPTLEDGATAGTVAVFDAPIHASAPTGSGSGDTTNQSGRRSGVDEIEPRYDPVELSIPPGNQITTPVELVQKLQKINDADATYPIRDDLRPSTTEVLTNHFEITLEPKIVFYEYKIEGIPSDKPKRLQKVFVDNIVNRVGWLVRNKDSFAHDSTGTIIAWKSLPIPTKVGHKEAGTNPEDEGRIWELLDLKHGEDYLHIDFRFVRTVNITGLLRYISTDPAYRDWDSNVWNLSPVVNALNIVISKCFIGDIVRVGANKFFVERSAATLGEIYGRQSRSLCTMRGYSYTIKPGMGKVLLNVNAKTSAFYNPLTVSEYLLDRNTFSNDYDRGRHLKGVRVYIMYTRGKDDANSPLDKDQARIKTIFDVSKLSCDKQTFKLMIKDEKTKQITGTEIRTVREHLQKNYSLSLSFPHLNAINVGSRTYPCWFAPEFLQILPRQIFRSTVPDNLTDSMLTVACKMPKENRLLIEAEGLGKFSLDLQSPPRSLKCPIRIDPRMARIHCHRLTNPLISYLNGKSATIDSATARWNLRSCKFLDTPLRKPQAHGRGYGQFHYSDLRYQVLFTRDLQNGNDLLDEYTTNIREQIGHCGVGRAFEMSWSALSGTTEADIYNALQSVVNDPTGVAHVVILITRSKNQDLYSKFKYYTDRIFGLQSIYLTEDANMRGPRLNKSGIAQYMANVMMKMNLKMGGINHSVHALRAQMATTLVIGADVTHPGPGSVSGTPSISAIVGSVGDTGGKFLGTLGLQKRRQEIIDGEHFTETIYRCVKNWYYHWTPRVLPLNILFYRDGVADTQYKTVLDDEVPHIKAGWTKFLRELKVNGVAVAPNTEVRITAVIVTKRHNTRFFPIKDEDTMKTNENCKPGTLVDNTVTSPYFQDFFLQSHNGLKGTARSAHYFVIKNDMNLSTTQLQDFTHNLCHTYVRATLGVSYASPAYYADRLCERGRCYLRKFFSPSSEDRKSYKEQKDKFEDQARIERGGLLPSERPLDYKKTKQDYADEKADRKKAEEWSDESVMAEIQTVWDADNTDQNTIARRDRLLQTMYWM